jgi:sugar lactone lactonase YvrE
VWDAAARRILFGDHPGGRILAVHVDTGRRQVWSLGAPFGSFGLCRSGRVIVAHHRQVRLTDLDSLRTEAWGPELPEPAANRFNDSKVGPDGCLWVGSLDGRARHGAVDDPTGSLYRLTPHGELERHSTGYLVSNGLAWSPDGQLMYHSDSKSNYVDRWQFDPATGSLSHRTRFITLTDAQGRPDGGACDTDGNYWSAGVSGGRINQISPDGEIIGSVLMPAPAPSMPCFAGRDLYVTSIRRPADFARSGVDIATFPHNISGLFRVSNLDVEGTPVGLFADE